jgi:hypothetical protein
MFGAGSVGNSSKVFTLLTLIPFGILIVFASISPDFDPKYVSRSSLLLRYYPLLVAVDHMN